MKRYSVITAVFACALGPAAGGAQNLSSSIQRGLHYTITMGSQPIGTSEVIVEAEHDGHITLRNRTRIAIKSLLFSYHYASSSSETWSGNQLISAEADTVEDGIALHVVVRREGDSVIVISDKGERRLTGIVATTSFWNLPRLPDTTSTFLDVETGADLQMQARFVKETEVTIKGFAVPCRLWRLSGDAKTQLWFDRDDVLVRVEYQEQGQRFVHILNRPTTTLKEKK